MSDEWPAPPPTLTNIESAVQRTSTAATIVAPPPSSTLSDRNSGVTQEEPALRFAPPVPLPRRSSVDVFGVTNQSSQPMKYSTLPANQRLSSAATDPQFILSAVCVLSHSHPLHLHSVIAKLSRSTSFN